ncbi:hypothetical protein [Candidatus Igneacidithiobacillus taiwanensis]|uniref:hypothetical protein n=1 Tax=Candidatus Igneacidithiobacillus taiwanensis TaxID=1945924 RepID=UPI0028A1F807|nr:hypothetical protein [Candidatus Igneacidithiobacillus taiwanensis]
MNPLVREVERMTLAYARYGGKKNRRLQRSRMKIFAAFCAQQGCRSMGQVGKRHVQEFFAAHAGWSPGTRYAYRLAIADLFDIAGLTPPKILDEISYPKPRPAGP